jgi:hypothetical protein
MSDKILPIRCEKSDWLLPSLPSYNPSISFAKEEK